MPSFREFKLSDAVRPVAFEPLRYYVRSQTRRLEHLVDLEECGFNGACSCEHFQMRCLKQLREDRRELKPDERPKRRCVHIRQALEYHAEISIRIVSRHRAAVGIVPPEKRRLEYVKKP